MRTPGEHIRLGRVVSRDDKFMLIEIAKSPSETLHVSQGDQFLTLVFVKQGDKQGELKSWLPWEEA